MNPVHPEPLNDYKACCAMDTQHVHEPRLLEYLSEARQILDEHNVPLEPMDESSLIAITRTALDARAALYRVSLHTPDPASWSELLTRLILFCVPIPVEG